jgi:hypothetical protein
LSDTVNITKNERGKIITAELAYSPTGSTSFTNNGRPTNGAKYSGNDVRKMLSNHVVNAPKLRDMSDYLYNTNGIYRRLIDTTKNLMSYEYSVIPLSPLKPNTKTFQNKYQKIREYLWECNFESTVSDIIFKLIKYGRYTAYDRGSYLQPLSLDYTRIIGINKDGNAIIQFNFAYFDEFSNAREQNIQLKGFDPIFRKMYMDFKKGIDNPSVNLTNELNWRTLPSDKTYTFKIGANVDSREGLGMFFATVDDILYYDEVRDLERAVISSQKRKIVVQQLPVDKDGNSVLGEEEIIQAHENLKSLVNNSVGVLTVLGGTKFDEIPMQLSAVEKGKIPEIQNDIFISSGIGDSALKGGNYSTGMINVEIVTNAVVEMLKQIESLWFYRKFKELVGNGSQYKFKLKFLGITPFNKDKITESFDSLLDKGGSISPSINTRGFDSFEYIDLLKVENDLGLKELFEPLMTSFTTSGKDAGRPSKDSDNGNTDKSKSNGGNNNPKPAN